MYDAEEDDWFPQKGRCGRCGEDNGKGGSPLWCDLCDDCDRWEQGYRDDEEDEEEFGSCCVCGEECDDNRRACLTDICDHLICEDCDDGCEYCPDCEAKKH